MAYYVFVSATTIRLEDKHKEIIENHGLSLSKFVRKKLEELE